MTDTRSYRPKNNNFMDSEGMVKDFDSETDSNRKLVTPDYPGLRVLRDTDVRVF
jgi:hypothetical protein